MGEFVFVCGLFFCLVLSTGALFFRIHVGFFSYAGRCFLSAGVSFLFYVFMRVCFFVCVWFSFRMQVLFVFGDRPIFSSYAGVLFFVCRMQVGVFFVCRLILFPSAGAFCVRLHVSFLSLAGVFVRLHICFLSYTVRFVFHM